MPREIVYRCGVCGNITERIAAKLLIVPFRENRTWNKGHYEAHADVGICCLVKISSIAKFQRRVPNVNKGPKSAKSKRASMASKEVNTHPGKRADVTPQGGV